MRSERSFFWTVFWSALLALLVFDVAELAAIALITTGLFSAWQVASESQQAAPGRSPAGYAPAAISQPVELWFAPNEARGPEPCLRWQSRLGMARWSVAANS